MITIFNDAKRITLSGWSWPSRHVASEMAIDFRCGRVPSTNINLQYVTPIFHKEFLDCIVKGHIEKLKVCIKESLAISLRVDGSVDRTQKHNVFAMVQIVKRDATLATLCLGFDVPKNPGAAGYVQCLKNIVKNVLPWDEFFALIISIVTDGESLNTGHLNGLVAQLRAIRHLSGSNLPFLSIWCVPHRTNLSWKSVSRDNTIASLISRARNLSKHFHDSGKRTQQLNLLATQNGLSTPLRYPSFFAVRWIEFVFNLFNATLRNWRVSIKYFVANNLQNQLNYWSQYETLHALTFLTDILGLLKTFQKFCQSDSITLIDVSRFANNLFTKLESCEENYVDGGWEQLFLQTIVNDSNNNMSFYDTKLIIRSAHTRRCISFTTVKRKNIVHSMIQQLKMRLQLDSPLLKAYEPFINFCSTTPAETLELCHRTVASDLKGEIFKAEYYSAVDFLDAHQCNSTLDILKNLVERSSNGFSTIKIVLARIVATKPHSADVERLISKIFYKSSCSHVSNTNEFADVYNKFKTADRSMISQDTLSNYLYVNTNMGPLETFDPTSAVQLWLSKKKRHEKSNYKSHQQEWFNGVFDQPPGNQKQDKIRNSIIRF